MRLHQELLTIDDIAGMYRVSRRYARDFLVKKQGFPAPTNGSTRKNPLWLEGQLRDYMTGECRTNLAQERPPTM